MSKKLYEESNIQDIANAIRAKNGASSTYITAQMAEAIRNIRTQPDLEELSASENGTYTPSSGKDGFSRAVVNVQPDLEELSASENGTYTPSSGKDGFSRAVVNVQPDLEELSASENGTYTPSSGKDGFSRVNVNVPSGGGSAVLVQKTITENGTYNALLDDDADGYSEVLVSVPSGGSGIILSGTADPTSDIGNNEDLYVKYAVYSLDEYTHSYGILATYRKSNNVWENYTDVISVNSVHIWTISTNPNLAVISYDVGNGPVEVDHYSAGGSAIIIATHSGVDIVKLWYASGQWVVQAIAQCIVDGTTYNPGNTVALWGYAVAKDFNVTLV